jgi:hypothetical protein
MSRSTVRLSRWIEKKREPPRLVSPSGPATAQRERRPDGLPDREPAQGTRLTLSIHRSSLGDRMLGQTKFKFLRLLCPFVLLTDGGQRSARCCRCNHCDTMNPRIQTGYGPHRGLATPTPASVTAPGAILFSTLRLLKPILPTIVHRLDLGVDDSSIVLCETLRQRIDDPKDGRPCALQHCRL